MYIELEAGLTINTDQITSIREGSAEAYKQQTNWVKKRETEIVQYTSVHTSDGAVYFVDKPYNEFLAEFEANVIRGQ